MRCRLLLSMCAVSVCLSVSRGWIRRRAQCVRGHSVQPLPNYFGLLFVTRPDHPWWRQKADLKNNIVINIKMVAPCLCCRRIVDISWRYRPCPASGQWRRCQTQMSSTVTWCVVIHCTNDSLFCHIWLMISIAVSCVSKYEPKRMSELPIVMSTALEVTKLMFAALDVSFNSGHYTANKKRQFLYINICSFSTIFIYMLALVHNFVRTKYWIHSDRKVKI